MIDLKYSEILKKNKDLNETLSGNKYQIAVLSNIITYQLNEILEYALRTEGINAYVESGNYDNILQDSEKNRDSNAVIIFWELANIIDGLQYKVNVMSEEQVGGLLSSVKSKIDLVFNNLKDTSLVIVNRFSSLVFSRRYIRYNRFDEICSELNAHLEETVSSNTILIDIDKVLAEVSIEKSVDFRNYYSSKALYSLEFYKHYAEYLKPVFLSANGRAKKALILDCDDTLWKGILGEDGFDGIEMSSQSKHGAVFEEFQHLVLELEKRGILIGLCSKNNEQDVNELIESHPDMCIKDQHIIIKKLNWDDKASNLEEIAKELNIGLDGIVFVDDSEFEINLVRQLLPQVTTLQVPKELHEFPKFFRENMGMFFGISVSGEDLKKTEMYKQEALRKSNEKAFGNLEDYLRSLELAINVYVDDRSLIPRMSQLTQKTNQFNLTTKRYTEADIEHFIDDKNFVLFAFDAKDRFGDTGVVGLSIVQLDFTNKSAIIDSLLMSCRVLGRNMETAFLDFIIGFLRRSNIEYLYAKYVKTSRNMQVSNFYDDYGLCLVETSADDKVYAISLSELEPKNIEYIAVNYGT